MDSFWRLCLACFEKELPPQQFRTWIKPLKCHADVETVTLVAPNGFVQQWIRDKFAQRIETLAREHFQRPVELKLLLAEKDTAAPAPAAPPPEPAVPNTTTTAKPSR